MKQNQNATMEYDVVVIGAGPGGLSAAAAAAEKLSAVIEGAAEKRSETGAQETGAPGQSSAARVAVLEREEIPGGILNQCVHDGFGIVRYGAQLSGPEYAGIEIQKAFEAGVEIRTGCMVTEIRRIDADSKGAAEPGGASFRLTAVSREGLADIRAGAIVLATGCRERTRGMLSIPGTRPAGIYTAGVAQNLINRKNLMVGRRVVILGSGDIGLIMARRLTLEGAEVICVAEVMQQPSGLARNVRQCLFDYDIPLHLRTTVSNIYGKGRLEAVELSAVDEQLQPIPGTQRRVDCDTLILSVGLIPENEVAKTAQIALDPVTNGTMTDQYLQTSVPGIFACGNCRAVMDLADFVSEQAETAGKNAAAYAQRQRAGGSASGQAEHGLIKWEKNPHNAARKGMPEEGSVTCTLCPKGCQVKVVPGCQGKGMPDYQGEVIPAESGLTPDAADHGMITTGNGCPRGAAFAIQEMTDPRRILTTTIRVRRLGKSDLLLPVRSDRPVALSELRGLAEQVRREVIALSDGEGIEAGDVLMRCPGRVRADIIAEKGIEA